MKIEATDTNVIISDGEASLTLLKKPEVPDYTNVTSKPYFTYYYEECETVWDRLCLCMKRLADFCPDDPYLGCYALLLNRLYPLLLSDNRAKNIIAYGADTDCMAYRVIQDFMTFLHEGNALTALAVSPFCLTAVQPGSCQALLYRLDTCPALAAVCDAAGKVKPGGLLLLYTVKGQLPEALEPLCSQAEKTSFGACTVYTLTAEETLLPYLQENSSEAFLLSQREDCLKRASDLQNLVRAMLSGASLPDDAYLIAVTILQQSEEILLSLYDYLEDDELPVRANALKEAILSLYAGIRLHRDLASYTQKLTELSEQFFSAVNAEFQ